MASPLRSTHRRRLLAATLAALLLTAGCAAEAGDSADKGDTRRDGTDTSASAGTDDDEGATPAQPDDDDDDGEVDQDDDPTTTEGSGGGTEVTEAQLEELLPTVDDLPDGYRVAEDDDDDEEDADDRAADAAMADACPDAADLGFGGDDEDGDEDEVVASFESSDERTLEVTLAPVGGDDPATVEDVERITSVIDSCETIAYETEDGGAVEMDLSARANDLGEYGMTMVAEITIVSQGISLGFTFNVDFFIRNGISGSVVASSGFGRNLTPVPADLDVAEELALDLDGRLADLGD